MEFIRLLRAEGRKMRRTLLPAIHWCIPVAVSLLFLAYYSFAPWSVGDMVSGYVEILGIALPLLGSIICGISVELEAGNHFQVMLGVVRGRKRALAAKWLALLGMELFALALAVGIFGAGFRFLGKEKIPLKLWLAVTGLLWFGSLLLYLWHLFLNFRFSKTVSMGIGMTESLLSALFLTGLGDGSWQYVPASYSARGSLEVLRIYFTEYGGKEISGEYMRQFCVNLLITVVLCAIIFLWFQYYEGRACDD